MTRDSASGTGPETDSEKAAPDTTGTTPKSSSEDAVGTGEATSTKDASPAEETKVAVDTTDDEPGDTQDTTDEGAVETAKDGKDEVADTKVVSTDSGSAPEAKPATSAKAEPADLTLRPLPTTAADKASTGSTDSTETTEVETAKADTTTAKAEEPEDKTAPIETSLAATTVGAAGSAVGAGPASTPATAPSYGPDAKPAEVITSGTPAGPVEPVQPPAPWGAKVEKAEKVPVDKNATLFPLLGTLVALAALAALLIGSMALPLAKAKPHDVPVGVAGAKEISSQLSTLMTQIGGKGTFEVHTYTTQADLRNAIEDREVYGGLYVDDTQAQMMVSTAAGIQASDALQTVANTLMTQAQAQVTVTDVKAQPTKDPRADGLSGAELPLVIVAALPAIGLILLYRRRPLAQVGGAVLASAALGLTVAAVLTYVSGSTWHGNYPLLAAGLAAGFFATTIILLGLNALAGRIALGLGVAVLVLFGAPLSGLSTVPEWLPSPWDTVGQLLPPGATATVLRSMAFFDGQGSKSALLVFIIYTVVGLALLVLGSLLRNSNDRLAELKAEEEALNLEVAEAEKAPATV
ncbi:hypothetical protein [Kineosporia sp. NBRC 101731]|uniref:hypothetical protein n=1 Tax=Kineosporia sp. NBRC 101731 TaxID=3032199 RepID=UPI0024A54DE2|nr:hypothetical protein [Kineosporia sp. NBRC 101731]GLY26934.1 hypothetical protein Kisp02_02990 [Kineosporia sp. NBRC 101731]